MTTAEKATAPGVVATRNLLGAGRYYLGNRWVLIALATLAVAAGLMLNWSWLVAAGIAPVLLSVLPCLVMCGFGLCAHKLMGRPAQPLQPPAGGANCCGGDANVAPDRPPK